MAYIEASGGIAGTSCRVTKIPTYTQDFSGVGHTEKTTAL